MSGIKHRAQKQAAIFTGQLRVAILSKALTQAETQTASVACLPGRSRRPGGHLPDAAAQ